MPIGSHQTVSVPESQPNARCRQWSLGRVAARRRSEDRSHILPSSELTAERLPSPQSEGADEHLGTLTVLGEISEARFPSAARFEKGIRSEAERRPAQGVAPKRPFAWFDATDDTTVVSAKPDGSTH
jgi:hypothetical protein